MVNNVPMQGDIIKINLDSKLSTIKHIQKVSVVRWTLSLSKRPAPFDKLRERSHLSLFVLVRGKILCKY
jgi:hypothetical protein